MSKVGEARIGDDRAPSGRRGAPVRRPQSHNDDRRRSAAEARSPSFTLRENTSRKEVAACPFPDFGITRKA